MKQQTVKNVALKLCVTAMFSALLVGGKQALSAIPNVEVVTILIAVCAFIWGLSVAIPAVCAFILCDLAIWGMGTWVLSYIIHWNFVALVFWLFSKIQFKHKVLFVVVADFLAVVLTTLFGVLTTAVDTVVAFANGFYFVWEDFAYRFSALYIAGISFFVTQIICNAVLFAVAFLPLVAVNRRAKLKMFDSP